MKPVRRNAPAFAALLFGAAALAFGPAQAQTPQALSPWDAQLYAAALDATKKGDFETAEQTAARVKDKSLLGVLEFQKLFHPTAYKATYAELTGWLQKYGDLPLASRVRALARKRQAEAPAVADEEAPETSRDWESLKTAGLLDEPEDDNPKAAREALNAGDLRTAYTLAVEKGDGWVAGLAAYRMKNHAEARARFEQVALDPTEDSWVRSGAAFWAARAAVASGEPEKAPAFLRIAADFPFTFYGLLAERQLGVDPSLKFKTLAVPPLNLDQARTLGDVREADLGRFVASDSRAKRAVGLLQVGLKSEAALELREGLRTAADDAARRNWSALALELNDSVGQSRSPRAFDPERYPTPELSPQGGFTIDKALVYALVRKESGFNSKAKSYAGAYGLMQVMPQTAAWLTDDAKYRRNPDRLLDPAVNLRVGQDYLAYLLSQGPIGGDVLRAVAAYNGGPAPVFDAVKKLGDDADPLLLIESIPVPQSRAYVEEVMAAYWIYVQMAGGECPSLDRAAAGGRGVKVKLPYRASGGGLSLAAR